ncbi:hypothetical protein, partial [Prevotella denticola]|uniref:hypothetical protein n=1 Tax=Prevotella denticola TaxID=28129 RepID=UPI00241E3F21
QAAGPGLFPLCQAVSVTQPPGPIGFSGKRRKDRFLSDGFPSSRETCFYLMGSDRLAVLLRPIRKIGQSFNPQRSTPGSFQVFSRVQKIMRAAS